MSVRRFEHKKGSSYEFWEIELVRTRYEVRYGKIGTEGQTRIKQYDSSTQAASAAAKVIQEKIDKGYIEVAAAANAADAKAKTDDRSEFAVLADQLQAAGDPWGKRIALNLALAATPSTGPQRRQLLEELAQLDEQHADHFLGELREWMKAKHFDKIARLTWEYGYIVRANVGMPDRDSKGPDTAEVFEALMKSPASEHLRELTVGLFDFKAGGLARAHKALADGIAHPRLESVFIGDFDSEEQEYSWVDHGDVSTWFPKAQNLRCLRLRGSNIQLGERLAHRKLARLEIETGGLPEEAVRSLARADLPELTYLSAWLGRDMYGGTTNLDALLPLFSSKTLPKLQHLGLQNSQMQDELTVELATSKLLASVSSVDLSMGTMREPGARAILDNADCFEHLCSLNLEQNFIPSRLCRRLRTALGSVVNIGQQRQPDTYRDEPEYYTEVGE